MTNKRINESNNLEKIKEKAKQTENDFKWLEKNI